MKNIRSCRHSILCTALGRVYTPDRLYSGTWETDHTILWDPDHLSSGIRNILWDPGHGKRTNLSSGNRTTYALGTGRSLGSGTWEMDQPILWEPDHLCSGIWDMGNGPTYPLGTGPLILWDPDHLSSWIQDILWDTGHGKRTTLSSGIRDMGNGPPYPLGTG